MPPSRFCGVTLPRRHVDGEWSPLEALFEHAEPEDVSEHRRIFACPLRFRSPVSGFRVATKLLERPLRGGNPSLAGILEAVAKDRLAASGTGTLSQALRQVLLAPGAVELSLEDAARKLGLSLRTLQRRPARTSYLLASIFAGVWVVAGCALGWLYLPQLQTTLGPSGPTRPWAGLSRIPTRCLIWWPH